MSAVLQSTKSMQLFSPTENTYSKRFGRPEIPLIAYLRHRVKHLA